MSRRPVEGETHAEAGLSPSYRGAGVPTCIAERDCSELCKFGGEAAYSIFYCTTDTNTLLVLLCIVAGSSN